MTYMQFSLYHNQGGLVIQWMYLHQHVVYLWLYILCPF